MDWFRLRLSILRIALGSGAVAHDPERAGNAALDKCSLSYNLSSYPNGSDARDSN